MQTKTITKQILLLPAAGKRLIAKSLLVHPSIDKALNNKTIVIIAGTTNGYVAEEILKKIGQSSGFSRKRFFRGITLPPEYKTTKTGRMPDERQFPGDVVIVKGKWQKGKTIFDIIESLEKDDVIIKGANALDLLNKQAAIYIGHPRAGTINVALQAVLGRRVQLILPVGLEKRISGDLNCIARKLNDSNASGPCFLQVNGQVISEIDAIKLLTGADAELVAGGGVCGAEGSYWIAISGTKEKIEKTEEIIKSISAEPGFELY